VAEAANDAGCRSDIAPNTTLDLRRPRKTRSATHLAGCRRAPCSKNPPACLRAVYPTILHWWRRGHTRLKSLCQDCAGARVQLIARGSMGSVVQCDIARDRTTIEARRNLDSRRGWPYAVNRAAGFDEIRGAVNHAARHPAPTPDVPLNPARSVQGSAAHEASRPVRQRTQGSESTAREIYPATGNQKSATHSKLQKTRIICAWSATVWPDEIRSSIHDAHPTAGADHGRQEYPRLCRTSGAVSSDQ